VLKIAVDYKDRNTNNALNEARSEKAPKLRSQPASDRANAIKALSARDPKWDSARFLERVKNGFSQIQTAWSNQDLNTVQGFLSDGVFERFTLQIQEQKDDGIRDHMEALRILHARIMQVEMDSRFDTIHVSIRASAVNYRVSLKNKRRLDGSADAEEFEEVWSFLRRPGSRTLEKPGLIEGTCPACGAPIEITRAAKCTYCQAFLRSGEYDWVLAEITQACEWAPQESKARPGIAQLMKADAGFSVQQVEDRVSVLFWRYYLAFRLGRTDPLLKHAHPDFLGKLRTKLAPKPDGSRTVYLSAAVGSVSVLAASLPEPESPEESFDRIPVEVRWSWKRAEKSPGGGVENSSSYSLNCTQIFVLIRRSGVTSNGSLALSSSCCKNCGAPETSVTSTICEYCQASLTDGSQDWILEQITDPHAPDITALLKAHQPKSGIASSPSDIPDNAVKLRGTADGLRWLAHIMCADGKIEKAELEMLKQYARTYGISQGKFNEIIYAARAGEAIPQASTAPHEITDVFRGLVELALADGSISDAESKLLEEFAKRSRMSPGEMQRIMESEKAKQGKQA